MFSFVGKFQSYQSAIRVLLIAGFFFSGAFSFSASKFWVSTGSTNFNDGANWSPSGVPGSGDDVYIENDGQYTVQLTAPVDILSLHLGYVSVTSNHQTLDLNGFNLGLTSPSTVNQNGILLISGGSILGGFADVTIAGILDFQGGALGLSGTISGFGQLNISGAGDKFIQNSCLVSLNGNITWSGSGNITMREGAVLQIPPGQTFDIQNDQSIMWGSLGLEPLIDLRGVLTKTVGTPGTPTDIQVPLQNEGLVEVQQGALWLSGGGSQTGSLNIMSGTEVNFSAGIFSMGSSSTVIVDGFFRVSGADVSCDGSFQTSGTVEITNGQLDLNSPVPVGFVDVTLDGGTLSGLADQIISGSMFWNGGTLGGTGQTQISASATMTVSAANSKLLDERTLLNSGMVNWNDGLIGMSRGAIFDNALGATFQIMGPLNLDHNTAMGGAVPAFLNNGQVIKINGSGLSTIGVPFTQNQNLDIDNSTLSFTQTFIQNTPAAITTLIDGALNSNLPIQIQDGVLTGSGSVTTDLNVSSILTVSPPSGLLQINGDLTLGPASVVNVEIKGVTPGTEYSQINVNGLTSFDGLLNISYPTGYSPANGDAFAFFRHLTTSGTFTTINGLTAPGGVQLTPAYGANAMQVISGTTVTWINPAGGSWQDASNWNPAVVPGPGFDADIRLPGSYVVFLDASVEIESFMLGDSNGQQALDTKGFFLSLNQPSTISPGCSLQLNGGGIDMTTGGYPSLFNQGEIRVSGNSQINVPFSNSPGSVIRIEGRPGPLDAELTFINSFSNEGSIILSSIGAVADSSLTIFYGRLNITANGSLSIEPGDGGDRFLNLELDNDGNVFIDTPVTLAPPAFLHQKSESTILFKINRLAGMGLDPGMLHGFNFQKENLVESPFGQALKVDAFQTLIQQMKGKSLSEGSLEWFGRWEASEKGTCWSYSSFNWKNQSLLIYENGRLAQSLEYQNQETLPVLLLDRMLSLSNGRKLLMDELLISPQFNSEIDILSSMKKIDSITKSVKKSPENVIPSTFSFDNRGQVLMNSNGLLTLNDNNFHNNVNALLTGSGTLTTTTGTIANSGTLAPGNPIGTFTILGGGLEQTATGIVLVEIGGVSAGIQYDVLDMAGDFIVDGNFEAIFTNSFIPSGGEVFQPVLWGGNTGQFNLLLPGLPPGMVWTPNYGSTAFSLTATSVGTIQFQSETFSALEFNGVAEIIVTREHGSTGLVSAQFDTIPGGSATPGDDYTPKSTLVQFVNGDTTPKIVQVVLVPDQMPESPETVWLELSGTGPLGIPDQAVLTILESGPDTLQFASSSRLVEEGDGTVNFMVNRLGAHFGHLSCLIGLGPGTAAPGQDFHFTPKALSWPDGDGSSRSFSVAIEDDIQVESLESFKLLITSIDGLAIPGVPDHVDVVIVDNDSTTGVMASWETPTLTLTEKDQEVHVNLKLSNPPLNSVSVAYGVSGTALKGQDHNLSSGSIRFGSGQVSSQLTFRILDDNIPEPDETLILTLFSSNDVSIGSQSTFTLTIHDDDGNQAPDTAIIQPLNGSSFEISEPIMFQASGSDPQGGVLSFIWEIARSGSSNAQSYSGQIAGPLSFTEQGLYRAICTSIDPEGNSDPTPAHITFRVLDAIPPQVSIIQPSRQEIQVTVGESVNFVAEVFPGHNQDLDSFFFFAGDEETRFQGVEYVHTFDQEGIFTLVAKAVDGLGLFGEDFVVIHVQSEGESAQEVQIVRPLEKEEFEVGKSISFLGEVVSRKQAKEWSFFWQFGDGTTSEGSSANHSFSEPGRYQVRFIGQNGSLQAEDSVTIFVIDPALPPLVDINIPTDLVLAPPATVFLKALVLDSNGHQDLQFHWDLGQENGSQTTPVLGLVPYPNAGTYSVQMYATTPSGLQSSEVSRTILVRASQDSEFEPNESFSGASHLLPGTYKNMQLNDDSSEDFFKTDITKKGQSLLFHFDTAGPLTVNIFDSNRVLIQTHTIMRLGSMQVQDLVPGSYFMQVKALTSKINGTLGYGFGISVLNPTLYFPEIQETFQNETQLGVLNPNTLSATLEFVAYNKFGDILDRIQIDLKPKGRFHSQVRDLFGIISPEIAWVQIDSDSTLQGYSLTNSHDETQLYALSAVKKQSEELYIAHIAEKTLQWNTRATLINTSPSSLNSRIMVGEETLDLNLNQGFYADRFNFVDLFGGQLPPNSPWGRVEEQNAEMAMAGVEIFGKRDGNNQVAGLNLTDIRQDNPNFTYIRNNIYFTHIARDTEKFWTGIALVNISEQAQTFMIKAFGDDGNLIGEKPNSLEAGQKLVQTATSFLDGLGSPANVDWILIDADRGIVGFELFGTHDNKQLAGFEASSFLKTGLCFPYYNQTGKGWHGVSVVNVSEQTSDIAFTLYNDNGEPLANTIRTLKPMQKFISTLEDLFPDIHATFQPGWVECNAEHPIAGFELFGDKQGEQLGGVIAQ